MQNYPEQKGLFGAQYPTLDQPVVVLQHKQENGHFELFFMPKIP